MHTPLGIVTSTASLGPNLQHFDTNHSVYEGLCRYSDTREAAIALLTAHPQLIIKVSYRIFLVGGEEVCGALPQRHA